jgi:hypothetical protein
MSQAQYARHKGWNRPYVSKLVKLGMIETSLTGEIDPKQADLALARGHDPSHGKPIGALTYNDARTQKERYRALLTKLEYEQRCGELVEVAAAEARLEHMIVCCRAKLLAMPKKLAPILSTCTSVAEIEATVRDGVYATLTDLARTGNHKAVNGGSQHK